MKRTPFAKSVGGFVPKITAKAFERFGFHSAEILTSWPTIVGKKLAEITEPERIHWPRRPNSAPGDDSTASGASLVIRVSPAHALDIEYRSGEVVDRINQYFGYRAITRLKILQAPLTGKREEKSVISETSYPSARPVQRAAGTPAAEGDKAGGAMPDGVQQALTELWNAISREKSKR